LLHRYFGRGSSSITCGADSIGLVGRMPSGPGVLSQEQLKTIIDGVPEDVDIWLLTSESTGSGILQQLSVLRPKSIQLVRSISKEDYKLIRKHHPSVRIVQVFHVFGEESIASAKSIDPYVDAILLDSGSPQESDIQLGGTDRTHNWDTSRRIVEAVDSPVYLAGGLNAPNILDAIEKVKPYGVDVCSGARVDGALDQQKLEEFTRLWFPQVH